MVSIISLHAFLAVLSVPLAIGILVAEKGTRQHKHFGTIWVSLIVIVAFSAIFIQELNDGTYSAIHLLIPWTLAILFLSIWSIRQYQQSQVEFFRRVHMYTMIIVFVGSVVIAGAFTLTPGRLIHQLLFGV